MTSVKLKFRASSIPNKEGTLYFQIIHERVAKQIKTSYHILESEWDKERNEIIYTSQVPGSRQKTLTSIRNKIRWENNRISNTIIKMENSGLQFTTEDSWKSHATLTLVAKQDLPTFGYNMIDPLKSWCWGSVLFYPFKISRFS